MLVRYPDSEGVAGARASPGHPLLYEGNRGFEYFGALHTLEPRFEYRRLESGRSPRSRGSSAQTGSARIPRQPKRPFDGQRF
jgi:hypothetical protein